MDTQPGEFTQLLLQLRGGEAEAEAKLIPLVYQELRRLAAHYLRADRPGHTLQSAALVHEAYLRLTKLEDVDWQSRSHFFAGFYGQAFRSVSAVVDQFARTSWDRLYR